VAWLIEVPEALFVVRRTRVQPAGAVIVWLAPRRVLTAAKSRAPGAVPCGRGTVSEVEPEVRAVATPNTVMFGAAALMTRALGSATRKNATAKYTGMSRRRRPSMDRRSVACAAPVSLFTRMGDLFSDMGAMRIGCGCAM
jgi:hypothetical protein